MASRKKLGIITQSGMQRQNVPSSLIADDVNNEIFALLGDKAFTLATGFAEIFTENETHDDWLRLGAGVICYVRDYSQRNVTLRIFDTNGGSINFVVVATLKENEAFDYLTAAELSTIMIADWYRFRAPEELFAKDTANFVVYERVDERPRRSSGVRNDERNDTSASAAVSDSLAASCTSETRKSSASSFANDLPSAVSRNRASGTSTRASNPASEPCHSSKYQSHAIKWEHEGTFRRFTLNYDDNCDAYEKLREHINRIQRKFKGRLAWKDGAPEEDSSKSTETKKSLFSSVSFAFSQAFEKPPPLDKRDIGKPTKFSRSKYLTFDPFRHLIHMTPNGDILQGCSNNDTE
ncbi:unnamed protein product [Toxocara canis]|uniref:Wiskott-Aldrich syndrome protein n=1 Tax=Toxocara canis TaxID=6265 RepID=A0A183TYQ2_TOXCA|nr:unnamed protein product [Toxocara canis]